MITVENITYGIRNFIMAKNERPKVILVKNKYFGMLLEDFRNKNIMLDFSYGVKIHGIRVVRCMDLDMVKPIEFF